MKRVLTTKDEVFINENYLTYSDTELGTLLGGHPKGTVASYRKRVGLVIPTEITKARRIAQMIGRTTATEYEDAFIKDNYLIMTMGDIEKHLGRGGTFVAKRMSVMGLVIPSEILKERRERTLIKPGNIPKNKGKKQSDYMSAEAIEKTKATRFHKGQLPHNTAPADGEIRTRKDKSGRPYYYIRIALGKWDLLSRVIWSKCHGVIPPKHVIVFKDGNTLNCDIDNLECISMEENMKRNTIQRYPEELISTIKLFSKLKKKINEKQN